MQDHPVVFKDQRAPYDDGLCPCDIYHPDFQHSHSGVSVHSTTRPPYISSSTSCTCTGVAAAAAGVVTKAKKYLL